MSGRVVKQRSPSKWHELLAVRGCRIELLRMGLPAWAPSQGAPPPACLSALLPPDRNTQALTWVSLTTMLGAYDGVADTSAVPGPALAWSKDKARSLLRRGSV